MSFNLICRRNLEKFLGKKMNGLVGMTNIWAMKLNKLDKQNLCKVVIEVLAALLKNDIEGLNLTI